MRNRGNAAGKPRRLRKLVVAGLVLTTLGLGGLAYLRLDRPAPRMPPPAPPEAAILKRPITFALPKAAPSSLWGDEGYGFPGYPQRAFGLLPKPPSDSNSAFILAMSRVIRAKNVANTTLSGRFPAKAAAGTAHTTPAPAASPGVELPVSTPLNLEIVYASWGPQAPQEIAALQAKIQGQVTNIVTTSASEWPVRHSLILYFFPDDRAAANLIAASLARITRRTAPVMMLRTKSPPRPGTVEILLPLRSGAELKDDNLQGR